MTIIENIKALSKEQNLSIIIYFRLKDGAIKLADINNNVLPDLLKIYLNEIRNEITEKENLEILNLSQADERKNVIFKYDFETDREPFLSINKVTEDNSLDTFSFSDDKLENIDGIIAKIANSKKAAYFYTKFYPVNLIKQGKVIKLIKSDVRFEKFNEELLQLTGKFDIVSYDNDYFIKNIEVLERYYSFEEVIKKRAKKGLKKITKLNILSDSAKFEKYLEKGLSRPKKLIKVMASSKVISKSISNEDLINFVANHPILKNSMTIDSDNSQFILKTNKHCDIFIKILDDDYLRSELTKEEYDAIAKNSVSKQT